jgi:hypothetical protein
MNRKPRSERKLRRGSDAVFRQVDNSELTPTPLQLQAAIIRQRFAASPFVAAVIAELAFHVEAPR